MHFHDSRGTALLNVFAALLLGARRVDAHALAASTRLVRRLLDHASAPEADSQPA